MRKKKLKKKHERTEDQNVALTIRLLSKAFYAKSKQESKPLPEPEPFALINDDIRKIKLNIFIKCYSGDLSGLIMYGEPSEKQLTEAWEHIKQQYLDACGGSQAMNDKNKELNICITQLNRVRLNIGALIKIYGYRAEGVNVEPLINELHADGYFYAFTPESIENDIRLLNNELIGLESRIEDLQAEISQSHDSKIVDINEDYFLEQLAELRKFEGYNIPVTQLADQFTVYDYCIAIKRYNKYHDKLRVQQQREEYEHR